eukprot:COSAG01_NODE_1467_length_10217_cov_33.824570_10_plen_54_part_00
MACVLVTDESHPEVLAERDFRGLARGELTVWRRGGHERVRPVRRPLRPFRRPL